MEIQMDCVKDRCLEQSSIGEHPEKEQSEEHTRSQRRNHQAARPE